MNKLNEIVKELTPDEQATAALVAARSPSDMESAAASKFRQMLTGRIDAFGQRLLFHLPRSPMSAYRWGAVGAPCTLAELRESLFDSRRADALDMLYSYVHDYQRIVTSLGPSPSENASHLTELARLILDVKAESSLDTTELAQLREIAEMLIGLWNAAGVKDNADSETLRKWVNEHQA